MKKRVVVILVGILFISLIIGLCIYSNQREILYNFFGIIITKECFDLISKEGCK